MREKEKMPISLGAAVRSSKLTRQQLEDLAVRFPELGRDRILTIAVINSLAINLIATFARAMDVAIVKHVSAPKVIQKAFAVSVAQLCHDNPDESQDVRIYALNEVSKLSGGPTIREYAVMWAAFGRGDGLETSINGITAFYVDGRFPLPGAWRFQEACDFADPICFGKITDFHRNVYQHERHTYDNPLEDLAELMKQ